MQATRIVNRTDWAIALLTATTVVCGHASAQSLFQGIGNVPGGALLSVDGLSADGSAVCGRTTIKVGNQYVTRAFRWTTDIGSQLLGSLPGYTMGQTCAGISADGKAIVGSAQSVNGFQAFRWSSTGGMAGLGDFGNTPPYSMAYAVSADAGTIVGIARAPGCGTAEIGFRWTQAGGLTRVVSGTCGRGVPVLVSSHGSAIFGDGPAPDDVCGEPGDHFIHRWTPVAPWANLPLNGPWTFCWPSQFRANAISPDGTALAATAWLQFSPYATEAVRWSEQNGFEGLGFLAYGASGQSSTALAVSDDGTAVVGISAAYDCLFCAGNTLTQIFRWTPGAGLQSLDTWDYGRSEFDGPVRTDAACEFVVWQDPQGRTVCWSPSRGVVSVRSMLMREYGLDLRGWCLGDTFVSADGTTLAGRGINPAGVSEGWIAHLGTALETPDCDADWDRNGFANGDDFDLFMDAFFAGDQTADYDGNCFMNGDDFDAFTADFYWGC